MSSEPPPPYSSTTTPRSPPFPTPHAPVHSSSTSVPQSFPISNSTYSQDLGGPVGGAAPAPDSGSAPSSGVQLTRDADLLIRTYLPRPVETMPVPGTSTGPSASPSRYEPAEGEKERLRKVYEEHDDSRECLSFPKPSVPHGRPHANLPLPLCLPQVSISARFDSAFARGYNNVLQDVEISEKMLLDFIDGLNLAIVASPPLRVVDVVGQIIGFVPFHWAMIAGIALQTAAQTGMRVLSKTLTDRYLRAANQRLFKPRGLSVRLCTTPAMLALIAGDTSKKSGKGKAKDTLDKVGRGVGSVLLHAPLPFAGRIVRAIADKPPVITPMPGESDENVMLRRRLALVSTPGPELAMPLRLEGLPPPFKPRGIMEMVNQWGVKFDTKKDMKKVRQNEQRRLALQRIDAEFGRPGIGRNPTVGASGPRLGPGPAVGPSWSQHPSPGLYDMRQMGDALGDVHYDRRQEKEIKRAMKERKASMRRANKEDREIWKETRARYRTERRAAKRERKNQRRARRGLPPRGGGLIFGPEGLVTSLLGPKQTRMQRRVANADLLEHWANEEILWIVVLGAEADNEIEGTSLADSLENEEHVDLETWRTEMELEREELADTSDSDSDSSDDEYKSKHPKY
ncbi:hypothetical protein VKT23_016070 [Stygiomarasmius scandens]|uniref:Uncharacterized protein n=1 Tax=Marasmiellus scandens TaxID=2682957 RepID=A0ABR1IZ26_9AGAR